MIKKIFAALALTALPFISVSASELSLPEEPAAEAPAASPAAPDAIALIAEYEEVQSALRFFSDIAFVSPQGSPQFLEASASGQYLRARLEELGRAFRRETGEELRISKSRVRGEVSFRLSSELNDVFGFYGGVEAREERSVPIKDGYCKINYVKNNVPFLVQSDSFLKKGEIIITFDDGPGQLTAEVSAAMKDAKAPSVFFVLGSKLGSAGKERARQAAADGHEISVHGYWHATEAGKPFTALSTGQILRELGGVKTMISGATGARPGFFRPPYGIITPEALKAIDADLDLVPVGWTIDTLDWSIKDPEELFAKTVGLIQQRGKGIVLMHDIHDQSRIAAKRLVKWLGENGYKVVDPSVMTRVYRGE